MSDIYLGIAIMVTLSAGVFAMALQIARAAPRFLCELLSLATVLTMLLYIRDMWDNMYLVRLLPFSNLIVVGNWFPLTVSFLAGLAWKRVPGRIWRKSLSVGALLLIGGYAMFQPVRGQPPVCKDVWRDGVSLQTTRATCSPACAATLLKAHGIPASEQEMAGLCLTRQGTHWQGLYRGLKLKTAGTRWDVEAFSCNLDDLPKKLSGPIILTVCLDKNDGRASVYREEAGWVPGLSHSTVLFKIKSAGLFEIGDPSVGREQWTLQDLMLLWHGQGMRLVAR